MRIVLPEDMDRSAAESVIRNGLAEVNPPHNCVRSLTVTDHIQRAIENHLGYAMRLTEGFFSAGMAIPALENGEVVTDVFMPARLARLMVPNQEGMINSLR